MTGLKERLRADLTTAMKARDTLTTATLRLALAAITNAEVAGTEAKALSDAEIIAVLNKEVRKRGEAAEAFAGAGRAEQAAKERAEADVLSGYLPTALSDDEVAGLVREAIDSVTAATGSAPTMRQMGLVVKDVQARAEGRADGSRIAAAVKIALGS
ncbi:MAG TPA: GatB/YqeY domain-containing protein [Nakamurella sp.]